MNDRNKDFAGRIGRTYRDSQPWWPPAPAAPAGAPNVVFVVLDDVGFSDLGCYGSEIATPRMDALAAAGAAYSNFHVTSMCSPTRACLLTGRNAHAAGVGIIAEWSSGYPGYSGQVGKQAATVPQVLHEHAYSSYAIGKWHLTNIADYGVGRPARQLAAGQGLQSLVRLPRCPDRPVESGALPGQPADPAREDRRLSPEHRPRRPCDRRHPRPHQLRTGPAVLHVSRLRRVSLAAPCAARVHRALCRPLRRRLGRGA